MRRRAFIASAALAAAGWPLLAHAQQPDKRPLIGVLMVVAENDPDGQTRVQAFRDGLAALGWVDGKTVRIEYRWGGGDSARIRRYAEELVALKPDVILANGTASVVPLKAVTTTVPIVCALVMDPVGVGVAQSLSHPGGNITGFSFINPEIIGKWRELLAEVAPSVNRAALLFNPTVNPWYFHFLEELNAAPQPVGKIVPRPVESLQDIQTALSDEGRTPGGGLIVGPDGFAVVHMTDIAHLAMQNRLPGVSVYRTFSNEGGLMSYGPDVPDIFRRSASYIDRILKGASPADLPIQEPTKFNFVINVKTAKALGLTVPPSLLATADEVIE